MNKRSFGRLTNLLVVIVFIAALVSSVFSGGVVVAFTGSGAGTVGDPFRITTCVQLQEMNDDPDAHYILMNDIDCSATSGWNAGEGFAPIGDESAPPASYFTGTLDGQNHVITGLFIGRPAFAVGLFGSVLAPAEISNVGLTDADITGDVYIGGLVGSLDSGSTVENSYVEGSVTGGSYVGGLVGSNDGGTIQNSYADATIIAEDGSGGLAGYNGGAIQDSYAVGSVTADEESGGFVGVSDGQISRSYSLGVVTVGSEAGGFMGVDEGGTVEDSFWNTETSGQATSAAGTGKTTAQMKDILTFSAATWDIETTSTNLNNGYPFLSWQAGDSTPVWYIYGASTGGSDADGISDSIEDAAPNGGDGNDDGTADSAQANVVSFISQTSNKYVTLEVSSACTISAASMGAESATTKDVGFDYPQGLMSFTLNCGTPGFTATVTQYYFGAANDNFVLRKYKPNTNAYFNVNGAILNQVTIGGQTAVGVTYQVTDGGDLDTDGTANGTIVDPVGLAQGVVGAPNTGLGG